MSISKLELRIAVRKAVEQDAGIEFSPEETRALMEIFHIIAI